MAIIANSPTVLVDGSSYLYRAYYTTPHLANSKGELTGAIYGVVNMIRSLLKCTDPERIAVIFDAKGKNFRHELFPDYKANRAAMPDNLRRQIKPLYEIIRAMGLPLISEPGVEADDIIGTLAASASRENQPVLISTSDKDMAQLVNPHITLINTMTNTLLDESGVVKKFGVRPNQIIDYLALIGDSVDNIPGVPKCGPKTAVKWLDTYQNLNNLLANKAAIKGKIGKNLREFADQLPLSYQLATIRTDVVLSVNYWDLNVQEADKDQIIQLLRVLEFKNWLSELLEEKQQSKYVFGGPVSNLLPTVKMKKTLDNVVTNYQVILSEAALERWCNNLLQEKLIAIDTKATSLNYMIADLVGLSFSVRSGEAAYIPVGHEYKGIGEKQLDRTLVLDKLRPILEDPSIAKVGQNLKYDQSILARAGISLAGTYYDTMLESYVLNSTISSHDMESMALTYLKYQCISFESVVGKGAKQLTFNQIDLNTAGSCAAEGADITLQLHRNLWPKLESEPKLRQLFEKVESPLVPILSQMERRGVRLNSEKLTKHGQHLGVCIKELEEQAHRQAGEMFNLHSSKQLQHVLFEVMGLPVVKKTPRGSPSTAEEVLTELAVDHPLPATILEYRRLSKLKSTYTDKLPTMVDVRSGRLHTSYHQAVTATGRLSSSNPNLQNIPIRNEEGRKIRQAFVAETGFKLVAIDYSQIELRIMAQLSGDARLLSAFASGQDIHRATAAEVFGELLEQVTYEQRRRAKAINFGLIYGISAFGLSRQLGIRRNDAQCYINTYFERYPEVYLYMEKTRVLIKEQGYVESLFGRRLYLPGIDDRSSVRRAGAERAAINAPMQGSASDIIKKAMISIATWIEREKHNNAVFMLMQVHDELVFEVAEDKVDSLVIELKTIMEKTVKLDVPLLAKVGVGNNWDDTHQLGHVTSSQ